MKKVLTLLAVTLLVVASVISGVFAVYTTTIDDANSNATTAKHFYVGAATVADFEENVEIAPSETLESKFTITNKDTAVSEVDIAVEMTVTLTSEITPLEISVVAPTGVDVTVDGNVYKFTMAKNVEFNQEFTVVISWPTGDLSGSDNAFIDKTASYQVSVVGTQVVA